MEGSYENLFRKTEAAKGLLPAILYHRRFSWTGFLAPEREKINRSRQKRKTNNRLRKLERLSSSLIRDKKLAPAHIRLVSLYLCRSNNREVLPTLMIVAADLFLIAFLGTGGIGGLLPAAGFCYAVYRVCELILISSEFRSIRRKTKSSGKTRIKKSRPAKSRPNEKTIFQAKPLTER